MMRCGPAPVVALKQGNVYLGYDAKFIFAEVNGDKVVWMVKPSGDMYPVKELCPWAPGGGCKGVHLHPPGKSKLIWVS